MAPLITSEFDHPRATRSALSHGNDHWEVTEDGQHERGGPGEMQGRPWTASTNRDSSDCAKLLRDQAPDSIVRCVTDVHLDSVETRVTRDGNDEGDFDRVGGVSRVVVTEAAVFRWCEQPPAQFTSPVNPENPDHSVKCLQCKPIMLTSPLGKECDQDLTTKHAIGGGATPQPRLGDPRLRDGIAGGDAGGVWFDTTPRGPLVGERQSLTVNRDSNVTVPEQEGQPGHQIPNQYLCFIKFHFRGPLRGTPQ
jgi:hypothetical protein